MKIYPLVFSVLICLSGCTPSRLRPSPVLTTPVSAQVHHIGTVLDESTKTIFEASDQIKAAQDIKTAQTHNETIQAQKTVVTPILASVKVAEKDLKTLETDRHELHQRIVDLESDKDAWMFRALHGLSLLGAVLIALAAFAFFTGHPKAIGMAVAGFSLIISTVVVSVMTKLTTLIFCLSAVALVFLVGLVAYEGWQYFRDNKVFGGQVKEADKNNP